VVLPHSRGSRKALLRPPPREQPLGFWTNAFLALCPSVVEVHETTKLCIETSLSDSSSVFLRDKLHC
jgi:hypothetical protein